MPLTKPFINETGLPVIWRWIYESLPGYVDLGTEDTAEIEVIRYDMADVGAAYLILHRYIFDSGWEDALMAFLRYYHGK